MRGAARVALGQGSRYFAVESLTVSRDQKAYEYRGPVTGSRGPEYQPVSELYYPPPGNYEVAIVGAAEYRRAGTPPSPWIAIGSRAGASAVIRLQPDGEGAIDARELIRER